MEAIKTANLALRFLLRRDQQDRQRFAQAQMMHGHQREHEQGEALEVRQGREPAGCRKQFQEGTEQHQGYPEQD